MKEKHNEAQETYTEEQVNEWLFNGKKNKAFPVSQLKSRNKELYKFKIESSALKSIGEGLCTSRVKIHSGSITDIRIEDGKTGVVTTSNNGDLLTGCGYAVAKAVINAAGAGLQTELYNRFGVPKVMHVPKGAKTTEGRGYAISCDSYEMRKTHNVERIEVLTVPMEDQAGVVNMYYDALVHSKDLDYIVFPMAGMTHPVINEDSNKSANFTFNAVEKFMKNYPDSKLQIIFTIYNDKRAEDHYKKHAANKDKELALIMTPSQPVKTKANPIGAAPVAPLSALKPSAQEVPKVEGGKLLDSLRSECVGLLAEIRAEKDGVYESQLKDNPKMILNFEKQIANETSIENLKIIKANILKLQCTALLEEIRSENSNTTNKTIVSFISHNSEQIALASTSEELVKIKQVLIDGPLKPLKDECLALVNEIDKNAKEQHKEYFTARVKEEYINSINDAEDSSFLEGIKKSLLEKKHSALANEIDKNKQEKIVGDLKNKIEPAITSEDTKELKNKCESLLFTIDKNLKSDGKNNPDATMKAFQDAYKAKITDKTSIQDLEIILNELTPIAQQSFSEVENINIKIKAFREGWGLGKSAKANAIQAALQEVPIEKRGEALSDPKVQEELAKHRHLGKRGDVYKTTDGKIDEARAARSYDLVKSCKALKNAMQEIKADKPEDEQTHTHDNKSSGP